MTATHPSSAATAEGKGTPATAIAALVLAVIGMCFFPVALVGGILGIITLVKVKPGASQNGKVFAIVAICLSALSFFTTGIVVAIAVPAYIGYVRRAKTAEAVTNLRVIENGVAGYYADHGRLPRALPLTPALPGEEKMHWPAEAKQPWADVGFAPTEPLYYAYEVQPGPEGHTFTVRAIGDLDGDGTRSTFEIVHDVTGQGTVGAIHIVNETE